MTVVTVDIDNICRMIRESMSARGEPQLNTVSVFSSVILSFC